MTGPRPRPALRGLRVALPGRVAIPGRVAGAALPPLAARVALVAAACVAMLALAGCTSMDTPTAAPAQPLGSPVEGVPIDIDAEGFSNVTAFTIRTDAGEELRFTMGTLENGAEFPPNHLAEHLAGSTSVRVFFRRVGGEDVVYRLEDSEPVP